MVLASINNLFRKIFGTRNDRMVKRYNGRVQLVGQHEAEVRQLTDTQLKARTNEFKDRLAKGEAIDRVRPEALAVAREVMDRAVGIRNIFNPAHSFDASKLPADMRALYDETAAKIAAAQPAPVAGCIQMPQVVHNWDPVPAWMLVDIPPALYQAVRGLYERSRPPFRARPFDVQLVGGLVLSEGKISEMKTGEGKTIVGPLACYLAALENLQCYVVTVNDYLVQRDRDWVFPFYYWLDLSVGAIHPQHMQPQELKAEAYRCNVVYGTCSEFGFDYLRDNMKMSTSEQVQKHRDFAIIDEVDSILIDEARTPLIISGQAHDDAPRYGLADQLARHLMQKQRGWNDADERVKQCEKRIKGIEGDIRNTRDNEGVPKMREEMRQLRDEVLPKLTEERDKHTQYYEMEIQRKACHLTHQGIAEAQNFAKIGSFYVGNNMDMPHLLENALRSHVIYQRDRDYVVERGEVVIVDENTGRKMIGRQWSDGLHQAVEAKEHVEIKPETQTMATVTIQNFFKLFKRLAGMTGTAITEATEFNEMYKLDVVCIPTNVAVVRSDREDLVFLNEKDKWNAILDEIKAKHDMGRPVLVGTTSVEKSERLSDMLRKRHGIQHEVLNAKQHDREASIVEHAGELGAVMIATNMAGRGTDIKLTPIDRAALLRHWQLRNVAPRQVKPEMGDDEIIEHVHRHLAKRDLKIEAEKMPYAEVKLALLRHWVATNTFTTAEKAAAMTPEQCVAALDGAPEFLWHRLKVFKNIEEMGGLHIVGTERHESRRIDNQLRGRAGRQGDRGSSRFFIALDDELMKRFAGPLVLKALSRLGMKEGDSIEHRWITKSVERAQRKVEEYNFQIRKQLVETDEVMEFQRNGFYSIRQEVLEGERIAQIIFNYIADAVDDAIGTYLDKNFLSTQIAEWCREKLDISVDSTRLRSTDEDELVSEIRIDARAEAQQMVEMTLGEYMSDDAPPEDWDLRGLSSWAMSKFNVNLTQNALRQMSVVDVQKKLIEAAHEQIAKKDLTGVSQFLVPHYPHRKLAEWADQKFGIKLDAEKLAGLPVEDVSQQIVEQAREMYEQREVEYPIDFVLDMAFEAAKQDGDWAANELCRWVRQRYELDWQPSHIVGTTRSKLREELVEAGRQWQRAGKLEALIDDAMKQHGDAAALAQWASQRLAARIEPKELENHEGRRDLLLARGRDLLRAELTQLERYVLLSILDSSWKDHLYAMDQLRDVVSMRSIGDREKDWRVVYKREAAALFTQMQQLVRDRVTGLIFKARLTPQVEARNVYTQQETVHEEAASVLDRKAAVPRTADQEADQEAADRAGGGGEPASRKQRRAAVAEARRKDKRGGRRR